MASDQMNSFRTAVAEIKIVSIAASQPHSAETLSQALKEQGIKNASVDLANLSAIGFTDAGITAISDLAKSFRPSLSIQSQMASNATLGKFIAGEIISHWKGRVATSLGTVDFDLLCKAVKDWFAAQNTVRRHVVPCTLFPLPTNSFSIGPVTFCHVEVFPSEEFGVPHAEFWPTAGKPGGFKFEQFLDFAASRHAPWMALIDVFGRPPDESARAADLAADVALAAIQIVSPGDDMRQLARATGRAAPLWRIDISQTSSGELSTDSKNQMPALARPPDFIAKHLASAAPAFQSMGRRLEGYLTAASPLPELNAAWCNAAYWYHEALAEALDTVAVAKLEIAMEVLFRAESMSRSKRRLLESFDAIFGLGPSDYLDVAKTVSVEQIVVAITTARSRILHGTWPTLHNDLPSQPGRLTISYRDVEMLTRMLLLNFSLQLDAYQSDGQTDDTTEALMGWIKAERLKKAQATSLTTP